jgi:hypothetical protein
MRESACVVDRDHEVDVRERDGQRAVRRLGRYEDLITHVAAAHGPMPPLHALSMGTQTHGWELY